jgi:uncharacterized membrane protein
MSTIFSPVKRFSQTHTITNKYAWLFALLVLFLIAVFYIHSTQSTYIIADEYLVYRFTRDDFGETISYLVNRDVHPPLWFSFFWVWRRIAGESDFSGRLQAIFFSLITLSLVYQMGKRWFGSPRYGIFAMLILSTNNLFFIYALQIRPYGLAMLLAISSMFAFHRWLTLRSRPAAIVYAVTVALLLYIHYFLFLLVILQGLFFLTLGLRSSNQLWRQLPLVLGFAFCLFSPWLPSFINQFQHIREVELASGNARGVAGSSVTTFLTSSEEILKLINSASNGHVWISAILVVVGIHYWWKQNSYRLALTWALVLPTITFAANLLLAVYNPRYIVNFIIGVSFVIAVGIGQLPSRVRWIVLVGFVVLNLWSLPSFVPRDIVPYRSLLRDLGAAYQPGDIILIDPPDNRGVEFNWQYAHQFSPEMQQSVVRTVEEALPARRIWYLTGAWFDENIRATYLHIEQTHPRQTGFGKCDRDWCYLIQLMEASPWNEPQVFGEDIAFWGADIDAVTSESIQMRLWWKLDQKPARNYSIGVHLLDKNGLLVGQSDGPIRHYGVQTYNMSDLEPGSIYIDFRSLLIPSGLPSGDYVLALTVYDWQTSERLLLANGRNYLELSTVYINQ